MEVAGLTQSQALYQLFTICPVSTSEDPAWLILVQFDALGSRGESAMPLTTLSNALYTPDTVTRILQEPSMPCLSPLVLLYTPPQSLVLSS